MEAWRDVEVAAAEALDGPTEADLEAIRARHVHRRGRPGARAGHRPRRRRVRRRAGRLRRRGGPLDPLRAHLLRRARHRARAAAAPRRRADPRAARARSPPRWPSGRASTRTRCASAAPTACTPSRRRFGLKLAGFALEAHRNAERLERAFAQAATGAISGAVGTYASLGPDFERRVLERLGPGGRAGLHPGRPARPPRRAAERDRAGRRRARALRDRRSATSSAPRSARSRSRSARARRARARCRTSATRSPPSASRGLARVLRGYAQTGLENVALWHERDISHSGAERVILPDATILLDYMQHLGAAGRARHDRPRRPDGRQPRAHERRAVLPAGAARARRGRDAARRRVPDRPAPRPAGVGHAHAAADIARSESPASELDLDAVFDYAHYMRHVPEVLERLEVIPVTSPDRLRGPPSVRRCSSTARPSCPPTCSTRSRRGSSTRSCTSRPAAAASPPSACSTPTRSTRSASR